MAPSKELVAAPSKAVVKNDLDIDQTLKASKALLAHIKKAAKAQSEETGKRNLLQDDDDDVETPVWLTLSTKRHIVDKARLQPGKIPLPHPLSADESTTICLITADPQRAYKNIVAHEDFPAALGKRITRVIDLTHLQAKFSRYEAQRKLFSEHDLFLGDERIINRLPKVLGKTFYKTTQKRPVPVILAPKPSKADKKAKKQPKPEGEVNAKKPADVAKEVSKAIGSALVSLSPSTNTAVKIGWSNWEAQHVADNAAAVVEALVEKWVPRKWSNVQGIYLKGPETAALPIWLTDELWLEDKDVVEDVVAEKANVGKKRKTIAADEEEAAEAEEEETPAPKKKSKKQKKEEQLPEGDDDKLDKQISERKTRLRTQKAKAKKAMDE